MSRSQSRIPSPSRSLGPVTPRRARSRRTLSMASPAHSDASGKLSSVVEKFIKNDKFKMSPLMRRSVLPDDTEIEAPRRASWWKRLEGSSRDVLEALDTNKMPDDLLVGEYEFEVEKDKEKTVSESSDNESVASIVVPERRLFNQKKTAQGKFGDIMGSRKSLGRTNIEDISIDDAPKNLFNKGPRNRPIFPAALLNSTNKTVNKTVEPEPEPSKPNRPNLFGQAGTKRKNMFTDFVLSESEEDSEVQPKVFGFKKYDNKRMSLGTRNRRMPSLTPSMTTEIDIDDWNLLPSSTMIGAPEVSRIITDEDMEHVVTEPRQESLGEVNTSKHNKNTRDLSVKNKSKQDIEARSSEQERQHYSKEASIANREDCTENVSEKDKKEDQIKPSAEEQESQNEKQDEDMENVSENDKAEENVEPSTEEQESQHCSKEASNTKQDEDMEDLTENDTGEERVEPSTEAQESQHCSKEVSDANHDENTGAGDTSKKKESVANSEIHESLYSSKEVSNENQDEEMEEMKWNDNDDEQQSGHDEMDENVEIELKNSVEVELNHNDENVQSDRTHDQKEHLSVSKNVSNKSMKFIESSVNDDQLEQDNDVVDDTPDNSAQEPTGRNKKKEDSCIKSPEAVLQNTTKDNESFRPIGRSTSFRKSKSVIDNINVRPSLATVQESTLGSEGSRNSSTEGSGWDSHRTTRKTLRQTFGKDVTTRKSLRALVMEQSAKRQAEVHDRSASRLNRSENKTVNKNASKVNPTKNKSVLEKTTDKNASTINKTKNKTVLDDDIDKNASKMNIDNHLIRDRRISNRNTSSDQLPHSNSPAHGTSARHVSDPLISEPQVSYHKSIHELNEPEMSMGTNNDSDPEISIHASYGEGMSREASAEHHATLGHKMSHGIKEISRRDRKESSHVTDPEVLDYEASNDEKSEQEISEPEVNREDHEDVVEEENEPEQEESEHEIEAESEHDESLQEIESDQEESQQEIESEPEESQQEIESEKEETQQEIESEQEESQQEIRAESEQEESQQEIEAESEQEESQQEIEAESEQEESQQEIEAESEQEESQQEIESESEKEESEQESAHVSDEPESERHSDGDENNREDSYHILSGFNSMHQTSKSNRTERVVFDNEISEQEIDYELSEHVSKQITDNDISEQVSEREVTPEITRSGVSEHSKLHDVSIGAKKSMLLMQMQKIVQQNMELRQKIREKVQNSLKPSRNFNKMSPIQSKFFTRRITMTEPKKPKKHSKPKNIPVEALPKEFVEDLMYKPPKRYQPANASWITKRLYKFLETKLEPKYDYRARVRAEELVQTIYSFTKLVRRRDVAPENAVDELKREMARLHIVNTHFDFYEFFHEFMPREIRIKINPDIVNKIPMPRNGVFSDILPPRAAVE